jgi:hypothetical protein
MFELIKLTSLVILMKQQIDVGHILHDGNISTELVKHKKRPLTRGKWRQTWGWLFGKLR